MKCAPECQCAECKAWRRRAWGDDINACEMPKPAPRKEADIYRGIRDTLVNAHCANDRKEHPCCGVITITVKHITMKCKLCGDSRQLIEDRSQA